MGALPPPHLRRDSPEVFEDQRSRESVPGFFFSQILPPEASGMSSVSRRPEDVETTAAANGQVGFVVHSVGLPLCRIPRPHYEGAMRASAELR